MEDKCIQCGIITKNKKYCSVECQHQGYKKPKNERIVLTCLCCKVEFEDIKRTGKKKQRQYCSRICKDLHQKEKYSGVGNPVFGRQATFEEKEQKSKMVKKMWKKAGHKEKVQTGQQKFKDENGYWPGTDEASKNKRKETCLEKYGVDHNWKDAKIREKCEITSIKKTGLTTTERARLKLFETGETSIEKIIKELLYKNKIKFKKNFHIYFNDKECKIYDFYLPGYNILIEADGDYWHGNPIYFKTLNEIQVINKKNDVFKNELAKQECFFLLRFWENQIKNRNFESKFLEVIQDGKKN